MTSNDGTTKPKKRGRPPVDTDAVNLRLTREMLSFVDDFRRGEEDMPTRPEAIRRLLALAKIVALEEKKITKPDVEQKSVGGSGGMGGGQWNRQEWFH